MHTKGIADVNPKSGLPDEDLKWKVKPEACTKYQSLLDDMAALRQRDKLCKVVVFTSRSRVQRELVALVKASCLPPPSPARRGSHQLRLRAGEPQGRRRDVADLRVQRRHAAAAPAQAHP